MKDLDVKLSQEVAEQAGKEITDLKKKVELNKDIQLSILQDVLGDVRDQRGFFKKLCIILCGFVFSLILGFVILSLHNQDTLRNISTDTTRVILEFLEKADVQIDTSNIQCQN